VVSGEAAAAPAEAGAQASAVAGEGGAAAAEGGGDTDLAAWEVEAAAKTSSTGPSMGQNR
jgi:hypothetical protein